jgi:hypothetical protein
MKKLLILALTLALALSAVPAFAAGGYSDVPEDSWAAQDIETVAEVGLMQGVGGGEFGYGAELKRCEFAALIARVFGWEAVSPEKPSFDDVAADSWYYSAVETALANGAVEAASSFRPEDAITRAELAEMFVRALGYAPLAEKAQKVAEPPFSDVSGENAGYITVACDIGLVNGVGGGKFDPDGTATREQMAAVIARLYPRLTGGAEWTHAFYAISSYSQREKALDCDAVTMGWSRIVLSGGSAVLDTSTGDWRVPDSYEDILNYIDGAVPLNLGVQMVSETEELLTSEALRADAIAAICAELRREYPEFGKNPYSGVTIDFEGLYGDAQREGFSAFLRELKAALPDGYTLYVMVQPVAEGGYFDGFDYAAIAESADKVILMAHDYNPVSLAGYEGTEYYKTAAGAPLADVYYSLRELVSAVPDTSKLSLALSFGNLAWETDADGKLVGAEPVYPTTATVEKRLAQPDTVTGWSDEYAQPWAEYTDDAGGHWFLWYENAESAEAKTTLARLMGVDGVSLWRLGELPEGIPDSLK